MIGSSNAMGVSGPDFAALKSEVADVKTAAETALEAAQTPTATLLTLTLSASGWDATALTQTATNENLVADGYDYIVTPAAASYTAYTEAEVYAEDISTDGQLVFHCSSVPESDLSVNAMKIEVSA